MVTLSAFQKKLLIICLIFLISKTQLNRFINMAWFILFKSLNNADNGDFQREEKLNQKKKIEQSFLINSCFFVPQCHILSKNVGRIKKKVHLLANYRNHIFSRKNAVAFSFCISAVKN